MSALGRLPFPPIELRRLVGPTDPSLFDNPDGAPIYPFLAADAYESVLDFGCGCGRVARQLMQQSPAVTRYLGIDLHLGMINWCQQNLQPRATNFQFQHHDVFHMGFNPASTAEVLPLPGEAASFTMINATSVFTHLAEPNAVHYLRECERVLRPEGAIVATWFFFDKRSFPMMQEWQNALYINHIDPTNATIFDLAWLRALLTDLGLVVTHVVPPAVQGFQWLTVIGKVRPGSAEAEFPPDAAPQGLVRPPGMPLDAHLIGRTD